MDPDRWSYRTGIVDGTARSGKLEMPGKREELPLVLDTGGRGPSLIPGSDLECRLETVEEEKFDNMLTDAVRKALASMGADDMGGAPGAFGTRVLVGYNEELHEVPLLTERTAGVLLSDQRRLAGVLHDISETDPLHDPIYIPGAGGWDDLEALFLSGVEIFDTTRARTDAAKGLYYTMTSCMELDSLARFGGTSSFCSCEACGDKGGEMAVSELASHNSDVIARRLLLAEKRLFEGTLREHVMGTLSGKPAWMSFIGTVESLYLGGDLHSTATYRKVPEVKVTYRDDLKDPDFELWRRRMVSDYSPLPHKRILLLLPCSARKPYSASRTHQSIKAALSSVKRWRVACQRVVLTSPLGAVPMELEDLYPASYYDIPVTGNWYPEERELMRELTLSIISRGKFDVVICHHGDGSEIFPDETSSKRISGLDFHNIHQMATEQEVRPAEMLKRTVRSEMMGPDRIGSGENRIAEAINLVNFSLSAGLEMEPEMSIRTSRMGTEIRYQKKPIFRLKRGGPVPTLQGGAMMWDEGEAKRVLIDDFIPKGTVFTQGIVDSTDDIRPGDIVLVGNGDSFRGVGRALLPSRMMRDDIRGDGVKILSHVSDRSGVQPVKE